MNETKSNAIVAQARSYEVRIETAFADRMKALGYKPLSSKYMLAQAEFFVGAMVAEGPEAQVKHPYWVICITSGRPIVIERAMSKARMSDEEWAASMQVASSDMRKGPASKVWAEHYGNKN